MPHPTRVPFRRVLAVLLLLCLGTGAARAAPPDSMAAHFEAGAEAYAQGQYARAVDHYETILATGIASGPLYHNLATAYVRLDRPGRAVRYYEAARRAGVSGGRIRHNLRYLRRTAGLEGAGRTPAPPLAQIAAGIPVAGLFGGGLLLLCLGAAVRGARAADGGAARKGSMWALLVAGSLCVLGALGASYGQTTDRPAVVLVDTAPLRSTPAATAPDTTLGEGTLLQVRRRSGRWTAVRAPNNRTGWVPTRTLGDV
jgi:hypothetical protein